MKPQVPAVLAILFLLIGCQSAPANRDDTIPRSVQRFLDQHGNDLSALETTDLTTNLDRFRRHVRYYHSDLNAEDLWQAYRDVDQRVAWGGPISEFGLLHHPQQQTLYRADAGMLPGLHENQTYVVGLRFVRLAGIAAAFRITQVSDEQRTIEFVYLRENISNGTQRITVHPRNGGSLIEHVSLFDSGRAFRDRFLYPRFHTRAIDEFHRHVGSAAGSRTVATRRAVSQ